MERYFYVYIMTNRPYGTLYVGITNDLVRRVWEHRERMVEGFTKEHGLDRLVWFEQHVTAYYAIAREKINLIQRMNPDWDDLFSSVAN